MSVLHHAGQTGERPTHVRHYVVFAATLAAVLLYLDRFCVGFAVDYIREDLDLTQRHMSWFISAFFWSYALAQVPSGWLSDRYGARIMLVIYILSWSFFTFMIGASYSLLMLLTTRLGCGLGQAGAYPTSAGVVSKWVPFANRGTASSIIAFGGRCGGAIAPVLTAALIVMFVPMSVDPRLDGERFLHGPRLCAHLDHPGSAAKSLTVDARDRVAAELQARKHIWTLLDAETREFVHTNARAYRSLQRQKQESSASAARIDRRLNEMRLSADDRARLVSSLNALLDRRDLYNERSFQSVKLVREAIGYLERSRAGESLSQIEQRRFNRFLLEGAFPKDISKLYTAGWRPVMYVYGLAGLAVAALFWILFRNRPEQHPWCNRAECDAIAAGRPADAPSPHGKPGMVPLKRLVLSRSMWFVCLMQVGTNVGWLFIYAWLPRYLIDQHDVPILERGLMASIPPFVGIAGMLLGGRLTDFLVSRIGLLWGRRLPMMVTRFSAAFGYVLVLSGWLASPWAYVAAFSLVALSTDMGTGAVWAFKQDVGGRYVGSILGWGNMWGNLGAAVSPLIYNHFLGESPTSANWDSMFLVCLGAFVFAGLCSLMVDATIPIAPPDEEQD